MVKTNRKQINCKFESSPAGCLKKGCCFRHWKGEKRHISEITVSPQKETEKEVTFEGECVNDNVEHDVAENAQDDHLFESSSFPWEKTLDQGGY